MKKEITNADILATLKTQGKAMEKQGKTLDKVSVAVSGMQVDMKKLATKDELTAVKSEILTSVDKVMKELKDHRLEDQSTFSLYVQLKERQDKRDRAFAKKLGIDLEALDSPA